MKIRFSFHCGGGMALARSGTRNGHAQRDQRGNKEKTTWTTVMMMSSAVYFWVLRNLGMKESCLIWSKKQKLPPISHFIFA